MCCFPFFVRRDAVVQKNTVNLRFVDAIQHKSA